MESQRKIFIAFSECRMPSRESFAVLRRRFSHCTDMLCHLHWLPVQCRIQFKLALLAFNARNNNAPLYLSCLLHNYVPGRSLRSSQSNLLCVQSHKLNFGTQFPRCHAYCMEFTSCRHSCMYTLLSFYPSPENLF